MTDHPEYRSRTRGDASRIRNVPIVMEDDDERPVRTRNYAGRNASGQADSYAGSLNRPSRNLKHDSDDHASFIDIEHHQPLSTRTTADSKGKHLEQDPQHKRHHRPLYQENTSDNHDSRGSNLRNRRSDPYEVSDVHKNQNRDTLETEKDIKMTHASNSDKLVSSPEPIPLPPPPSKSPDSRRTDSALSNSSHSPDDHRPSECQKENVNRAESRPQAGPLGEIDFIKSGVFSLLHEIKNFEGLNCDSKEYRRLDEMLTRCMLKLDNIQCGDSSELRLYRKAAVKFIDQASDILQRKMQINADINTLIATSDQ